MLLAIRPEQVSVSPGRGRRRARRGGRRQLLRPRRHPPRAGPRPATPSSSRGCRPSGVPTPGSTVCLRVSGDGPGLPAPEADDRRPRPSTVSRTPWSAGRPRRHCSADRRRLRDHVRRPGALVSMRAAPSSAPTRRLGPARGRQRRRDRGHLPRRAGRGGIRCCWRRRATPSGTPHLVEHYRPDVVQVAGESSREVSDRAPGTTCTPTWPCCSAPRAPPARPSWSGSPWPTSSPTPAASPTTSPSARPTERSPRLPLHYCYGLSVLNSHLVSGAAVVLTDLSVADECFWDLAPRPGATSFAGVPYTFDLLDASGFGDRALPALRYLTQAGGRMEPERVRAYAELGRARGWDLFVMYGQTEATARMAYLPPGPGGRTARTPSVSRFPAGASGSTGSPDGVAVEDVGELVYSGPNVMMGYAEAARRPGARRRAHRAAHRRPGPAGRRRAVGDRGPARPARQAVRPSPRPRPGRAAPGRARPARLASWCTATDSGCSPTGPASVERTRRAVLELHRAARLRGPGGAAGRAAADVVRQARLRRVVQARRPSREAADEPSGWRAPGPRDRRGHPRPVRRPARPPRRDRPRQLRRPRRRLAVVRRGLDAPRPGTRHAARPAGSASTSEPGPDRAPLATLHGARWTCPWYCAPWP